MEQRIEGQGEEPEDFKEAGKQLVTSKKAKRKKRGVKVAALTDRVPLVSHPSIQDADAPRGDVVIQMQPLREDRMVELPAQGRGAQPNYQNLDRLRGDNDGAPGPDDNNAVGAFNVDINETSRLALCAKYSFHGKYSKWEIAGKTVIVMVVPPMGGLLYYGGGIKYVEVVIGVACEGAWNYFPVDGFAINDVLGILFAISFVNSFKNSTELYYTGTHLPRERRKFYSRLAISMVPSLVISVAMGAVYATTTDSVEASDIGIAIGVLFTVIFNEIQFTFIFSGIATDVYNYFKRKIIESRLFRNEDLADNYAFRDCVFALIDGASHAVANRNGAPDNLLVSMFPRAVNEPVVPARELFSNLTEYASATGEYLLCLDPQLRYAASPPRPATKRGAIICLQVSPRVVGGLTLIGAVGGAWGLFVADETSLAAAAWLPQAIAMPMATAINASFILLFGKWGYAFGSEVADYLSHKAMARYGAPAPILPWQVTRYPITTVSAGVVSFASLALLSFGTSVYLTHIIPDDYKLMGFIPIMFGLPMGKEIAMALAYGFTPINNGFGLLSVVVAAVGALAYLWPFQTREARVTVHLLRGLSYLREYVGLIPIEQFGTEFDRLPADTRNAILVRPSDQIRYANYMTRQREREGLLGAPRQPNLIAPAPGHNNNNDNGHFVRLDVEEPARRGWGCGIM
jgi:hypothetical protein